MPRPHAPSLCARPLLHPVAALLIVWFLFCNASARGLEREFVDPPDSSRPWAFWYWINGNISKEGLRADLEDMKRVGIGGAMIFDGSMYLPPGPIRYGTDAWHEHVQYAIAAADELGIEIGVMNCAGWATAGGPWNSLEQSMKMIVWSEQPVEGGKRWEGKLPLPPTREGFYRDVAVLAIPEMVAAEFPSAVEPKGQGISATFTYAQPVDRCTLIIPARDVESGIVYTGTIEASDDGIAYRTVCNFTESAKNWLMPIAIALPATNAQFFRVTFDNNPGEEILTKLALTNAPRIGQLAAQLGVRPMTVTAISKEAGLSAEQIIDLTGALRADGTLSWDAPVGSWTILRIGYTTTAATNHPAVPEGTGWEVDKFDPVAVSHHFDNGLGRIIREAGDHVGRSFKAVVTDSWEAGPQTWTAAMPSVFEKRRGYAIGKYAACFTGRLVGSRTESEAFLRDFRKTLGDLYAEAFYGTMARRARENKLFLIGEGYGGVLDEFKVDAVLDVPAVEFWNHDLYKSCGIVPSVAHTTGKQIVVAEAFTSRQPNSRWTETPFFMKPFGDIAYALGVNRFALHCYVHQPRNDIAPGFTLGRYGTHFGRLNSWWPLARGWFDYVRRCQFMLQQGAPAADLLYLYPEKLQTEERDLNVPWPEGYRGDHLSVNQLADTKVESGRICIKGATRYRALVLPDRWHASLDHLRQLSRLRQEGAVILGTLNALPAGVRDLAGPDAAAWREAAAGLADLNAPKDRFDFPPDFKSDKPLRYFHRAGEGFDFYFIASSSQEPLRVIAEFRITGLEPELWDPASGEIQLAAEYTVGPTHTRVPLKFDPAGSVFVVFRKQAQSPQRLAPPAVDENAHELTGPWQIRFQTHRGAPASITLDQLASLSEHSDAGIRYFSGVATYAREFEVPAQIQRCRVDLGAVHDIAEVRINGEPAGNLWKPPFVVDVTSKLRPGTNTLEVLVANRWINRLIGDEQFPPDADYVIGGSLEDLGGRNPGALRAFPEWWNDPAMMNDRKRIAFAVWKHWEKNDPLVKSGLEGPVRLLISQ